MEEFKGTPGPWFVADDALGNMTLVVLSKQYPFEMMSKANLDLITAAPELLEALQLSVSVIKNMAEPSQSKTFALEMATAAVAKALGK